jgi:UDP-N-acetylglucosamine 2-epimerase (non-hydrolysing)
MKVMTIVGTRPEIIKLSRVASRLDETVDHVLVHTGQNFDYELNEIFFDELGMRAPDHYLDAAGETAAETIGRVIAAADVVLEKEKPDAVLVLGDTNSALSVISAKRRQIPIFHMEAGNRCFDQRVPEEINRRLVDHLSDVNLPYTEHARRYLLDEGFPADRVIKTGSPQREVLEHYAALIDASAVHARLQLEAGRYFAVSLHREENVDAPSRLAELVSALNFLAAEFDMPLVLSTHPRTKARLDAAGMALDERVRSLPPLGLPDYVALQRRSYVTISDSGTITEESSIVGFPAITVREAHERPEGMDEGVLVMSGLQPDRLLEAIQLCRRQYDEAERPELPADYQSTTVSWKVAKIILSYTDFVNRRVWSR